MKKILSSKEYNLINDVESWLFNYNSIKASINNLRDELDEEFSLSGVGFNESSGKTNKFNSNVENTLTSRKNIEDRICFLEKKIKKVDKALDSLTNLERDIIKNFYIKGLKYYEFTGGMFQSEITCKRIKKRAINKMVFAIYGIDLTGNIIRQNN